jgi:hypothetical protein
MNAEDKKPTDAPALAEQDWDAVESGELEPTSAPQNGDLRYPDRAPGEHPEEDDDNAEQESDEALPNDSEEAALRRDDGKESGLFDEV